MITDSEGKVLEATEYELFKLYLNKELDYLMPFDEYLFTLKDMGVRVLEDPEEESEDGE